MADTNILVNLDRCIGCWTCSLSCKVGNQLDDDVYYQTVRTLGNGDGIDRPAGVWPNLTMSWLPVWGGDCTKCAPLVARGENPYCVRSCPCDAITYGEAFYGELDRLQGDGFRVFKLPSWENARDDVTYAGKRR
ncbi:hypothetical protein C1878_00345 [Gordonibacter sp. 28C]|uniref:hypothetical protein n=1 Tax=Gordonibacter sp. 28C TaxID=2078569 RepID=UPI000DF7849D|nr:hypothetical protein [Gordonibacter sp. 28C]RDB64351.1 hypothetical protein C1878_00345 [Gordonibacter sp. 28C]